MGAAIVSALRDIAVDQPLSALALHTETPFGRANMNALKMQASR
jgi:hypothetical protein